MGIDETKVAAAKLRDTIIAALNMFDAETDHLHPDVEIGWRDVTEFRDDRVVFVPVVTVSVKVFV
jgi:hypothetical protein